VIRLSSSRACGVRVIRRKVRDMSFQAICIRALRGPQRSRKIVNMEVYSVAPGELKHKRSGKWWAAATTDDDKIDLDRLADDGCPNVDDIDREHYLDTIGG